MVLDTKNSNKIVFKVTGPKTVQLPQESVAVMAEIEAGNGESLWNFALGMGLKLLQ